MVSWSAAIDAVGKELLDEAGWWQEIKAQDGWREGAPHRTAAPMHFVSGNAAPWYMESVFNTDSSREYSRTHAIPAVSEASTRFPGM